jgi:hypothetical protein
MKKFRFRNSDGANRIKKLSDIRPGDIFYNKNISGDRNWTETLKREDLKVVQILDINDGTVKIVYYKHAVHKGKIFLKSKIIQLELIKLFNYLKTGKINHKV